MSNTRLLRTTSSRNVCVFCACRFNGLVVPPANTRSPIREQRRTIIASATLQQNDPSTRNSEPPVFLDAAAQARAALQSMQSQQDGQKQKIEEEQQRKKQKAEQEQQGKMQQRVQQRLQEQAKDRERLQQDRLEQASPREQARLKHDRSQRTQQEGSRQQDPRRQPARGSQGSVVRLFGGDRNTPSWSDGTPPTQAPFGGRANQQNSQRIQEHGQRNDGNVQRSRQNPQRSQGDAQRNPSADQRNPGDAQRSHEDARRRQRDSQRINMSQPRGQTALGNLSMGRRAPPPPLPTHKVQPPPWARATVLAESAAAPIPRAPWLLTPSSTSSPQAQTPTEPTNLVSPPESYNNSPQSKEPENDFIFDTFGQLDSTRQALAQTRSTKEDEPPNPLRRKSKVADEEAADLPRFNILRSSQAPDEQSAKPFDPEVTSNWSILKQKKPAQPSRDDMTTTQPPMDVAHSRKPSNFDPQDLDARFEEYRSRRATNQVDLSKISSNRPGPPPVRRIVSESRACIRCGGQGHSARDCPSPPAIEDSRSPVRRVNVTASPNTDIVNRERQSSQAKSPNAGIINRERQILQDEGVKISYSPMQPVHEPRRSNEEDSHDRDVKPRRRFTNTPAPDADSDKVPSRRSAFFAMEDDEDVPRSKPAKGRRNRSVDQDEEEDDRPGRRLRFEDDPEAVLDYADYEAVRNKRIQRKKERQAKKDKAAKQAVKAAERRSNKAEELASIRLPEFISVANLVQALNVRYETLIRKMEQLGFTEHSHDHILNAEEASMIAMEFNFDPAVGDPEGEEAEERDLKAQPLPDDLEFLPTRPPIVAIMGHVDHGKTTILDYLRESSVAASEHGGITQHIGAFSVPLSSGKTITFLDTPGHAAFLEMRKRGATVTDIIVLVVAADDSVKPQTIEAIKHAKAASVPIVVAVNKIDKEEANVDRVKQDLARNGVEIEDYGGDTQVVPVSGKTGEGIPDLEESISTLSEILDHRADPTGLVEGWVLEATTKKAGRVATVLVRRGTLTPGTILVAGKTWTRVRTLRNEAGTTVLSAGPGTPVEVDGWRDQPAAGDEALQAPTEQKATDVAEYRVELAERKQMAADIEAVNTARREEALRRERERERLELEAEAAKAAANAEAEGLPAPGPAHGRSGGAGVEEEDPNAPPKHTTVPFIIKADVSGSVEAVSAYLLQLSNPLCSPTILRAGVGAVSEFDIEHAAVADGHLISFNMATTPEMRGEAERRGVRLIEENVIYRIVDDVRGLLEEKLPMLKTQRVTGEAEVAAAFEIGIGGRKKMRIAGVKIRNGVVGRGSRVRVMRGERKIYDGVLTSLKNVKKDVKEMRKGTECGMGFDGWEDFDVGDTVQTFEEKMEKRTLPI